MTLSASYTKDGTEIAVDLGTGATVTLKTGTDDVWDPEDLTYTWTNVPVYKELSIPVVYRVTEAEIPAPTGFTKGYTATITPESITPAPAIAAGTDLAFVFQIKNSHTPETMDFEFYKLGETLPMFDLVPLERVTFRLYKDPECQTPATMLNSSGQEVELVAVSDAEGKVSFPNLRFDGSPYYMLETDQGEHDAIYWDNSTVYVVTLTPATETAPATASLSILDGTGLSYTGKVVPYTTAAGKNVSAIVNELVNYDIELTKLDGKDNSKAIVGAKFDFYAEPANNPAGAAGTTLPTIDEVKAACGTPLQTGLTTDSDGKLPKLETLYPGTYYLIETEAPRDYWKLDAPIKLTVAEGEVTMTWRELIIDGENFNWTEKTETWTPKPDATPPVPDGPQTISFTVTDYPKYGSLTITKLLPTYEDSESATFTFNVVATLKDADGNDQVVYSNVVALTLSAAGSTSETLTYIPAGSHVVVTETNHGAHYELDSTNPMETTIEADVTVGVDFTNKYNPIITGGHGIENTFEPDDTGSGWHCTNPDREE